MAIYRETIGDMDLPVVILKGVVAYPSSNIAFDISDGYTGEAVRSALINGGHILLLSLTSKNKDKADSDLSGLETKDFFSVGTVANIISATKSPDGKTYKRVVCAGLHRAVVNSCYPTKSYYIANVTVKDIVCDETGTARSKLLIKDMHTAASEIAGGLPQNLDELFILLEKVKDPGVYADLVSSSGILTSYDDRREILECFDPLRRAELLICLLEKQIKVMQYAASIHRKTQKRLNKAQKDYFLREELNVIRDELGEGGQLDPSSELMERIDNAVLPNEVREGLTKECNRMSRIPFGSAELTVLENHIELCLDLPWAESTQSTVDVKAASRILENDHYGLEKVKERILEFLAVRKLNPDVKSQILCLVGPPGTGKTSIASSIARALGRKYVRVSLGGIRDEAEIRGHRKTYIGAMPGRIITAIKQAGVKNPLMLLDEIDKMASDNHGDPCAAMLEVLDAEQNCTFRDHFVEFPFDLSDVFFVATANSLENIPRPLLDRMEVIELGIYTRTEKLMIAKKHLIPKQIKRHGLNGNLLRFTDSGIYEIIDGYTREAGVRNLERTIADIARKYAKKYEAVLDSPDGETPKRFTVTDKNVKDLLGARKIVPDRLSEDDEIGAVTGLAYTQVGGDTLEVEAVITDGKGKLNLTGSLGDVMKESANIAVTCARTVASDYGYTADFTENKDIHIHVPGGAVPKDGPSAGITMCTALVSALSGIKVRHDMAMTGELSLRGHVLPIGGLKEKTMAAYQAGIKTIIIPKDNEPMLEDVDKTVLENVNFIPCSEIGEVLRAALVR